jgi:hypothetical protein
LVCRNSGFSLFIVGYLSITGRSSGLFRIIYGLY